MEACSAQALLDKWEHLREIKNLMGRLSTDYVLKEHRSMLERYWSTRQDICLGINEGWFDSHDAVKAYYENQAKRIELESRLIQAAFTEELGSKAPEDVYGVGMLDYKPVDTPVLELAEDRLTAKGLWTIRGSHSILTPGGPMAYWEWGWFAVDFIFENNNWKIWHMQYLQDVCRPCGAPWTGNQKTYKLRPEFAEITHWVPLSPSVPANLHERYSTGRKAASGPRLPEPYRTFSETFTYGRKV